VCASSFGSEQSRTAQDVALLTTKLYIPLPRPNLVPRPRLIQRLDQALRQGHRLTLVSAPPGFGKTTLVSEWVCKSPREVAWISLDEGDDDPTRFLNYLIAALQQVDGRIGRTVQPLLGSPGFAQASSTPLQGLVTSLINDVTAADTPLILVLDDYQLISSPAVHQIIRLLLDRQPPRMHTVLSTRQDPPLALHQWRARGQLTEIRERDLRFTAEEAAEFLNQTMSLDLPAGAVAALEARTEGWIAGLQLAALALQENPDDTQAFIAAFTGDDRYVADYLVAEVLQRQPPEVRQFLRQTAILDRLTAPLCDAVRFDPGRTEAGQNSQAILEQLARSNLFLLPLDHRHEWYRYHRLFAQVLRATLDPEEEMHLHQRAARWHEANGLISQAIHHALAHATASNEWDDVQRLIRLAAEETLYSGNVLTVAGWLDALPDERVRADGELATYQGWVQALVGDMDLAQEYARTAEALLRHQEPGAEWGKLLALRSFIAVFALQEYAEAIDMAAGALQVLDQDQAHWRVIALWAMAESQERTANITEAIATLREARRTGRLLGNQVFAATVELFLAIDLHLYGQRRQAIAVCEEAIAHYVDDLGRPSPVTSLLFSRLGTLHYEANQLQQARRFLDQGLALGEQLALEGPLMFCYGFAAPTLHALGETGAALEALQKAHQFASRTTLSDVGWVLALEANIHLQLADLLPAIRWAETSGLSPDDEPQYLHMEQHLVYARLLVAQGRLYEARRWLARLERITAERALYRWLLTVHLLQALVAMQSGDRSTAVERLGRALEIAAPGDYYRAFLDEDEQLLDPLPDLRHLAPDFVDQLLAYAGRAKLDADITSKFPAAQPLVEPLSERELEVLRLIAAGFTNREIAQELVIAVGTVKRHINNLYGKLGMHSRTQATARARDLGLI
jgi:LuxR family maltose regulon positive regulatory protein